MTVNEVARLQKIIADAEIQLAKKQGQFEALLSEMEKEYGTSDIEKIKQEQERLEREVQKTKERVEKLLIDLENVCDWEEVENLLCR